MGVAGFLVMSHVREERQKREASRAAYDDVHRKAKELTNEMSDAIEAGEPIGQNARIDRYKEKLKYSADQMRPDDAEIMRATAKVLEKTQPDIAEYERILGEFNKVEIFAFKIDDRPTLEARRQMVRDFLAANARLKEFALHFDEHMQAAFAEAKLSPTVREAAQQASYGKNRFELQLRIREKCQALGETALAVFDLLERRWGQWKRDPIDGAFVFEDEEGRAAFDGLMKTIAANWEEQRSLELEMAEKLRKR
jgi:hypothetical protein